MAADSTGYSKTPLSRKLGLTPGSRVRIVNAPNDFWDKVGFDSDAFGSAEGAAGPLDWQQLFVRSESELEKRLPSLREAMHDSAVLWVSWPKGGKVGRGDLVRESVREIVLRSDLVDVKVCAFDETWSALKFVIRRSRRG